MFKSCLDIVLGTVGLVPLLEQRGGLNNHQRSLNHSLIYVFMSDDHDHVRWTPEVTM